MSCFKKSLMLLYAILFIISNNTLTNSFNQEIQHATLDLDNEFAAFDSPDVLDYIDHTKFNPTRQPVDPKDIVQVLLAIGAIDILKEEIYLKSNTLRKRSLLDLPLFLPNKFHYPDRWTIGGQLFWNQTSKQNFTKNSDAICSYLGVESPTLLEKLATSLQEIQKIIPNFSINPLRLFPIFKNTRIQERRIGIMFHSLRQFNTVGLRFLVPMHYLERNFFLTNEEQSELAVELGEPSKEQQDRFRKEHLICDKIGLGDTRLELDWFPFEYENISIKVGMLSTIPTGFSIIRGIKGSTFDTCPPRPDFSLVQLFEFGKQLPKDEATERTSDIVEKFSLGALDSLAANLLETKPGNHRHFGLGGFLRLKGMLGALVQRPWAQKIAIRSNISFEHLFSAYEKRFFVEKQNEAAFDERDFEDDSKAEENLAFLEEQFINKFYPFTLDTYVNPGPIFRLDIKAHYEGKRWGYTFGPDFWAQGSEKFLSIKANKTLLDKIDTHRALLPWAYQVKLLGSIFYQVEQSIRKWIISINGDGTFARSGIGKDFNVTLDIEASF